MRPEARRSSTILRSPNSDWLASDPLTSPQSMPLSAKKTSRSACPRLRAAARTRSADSSASSGSSPWIRYIPASDFVRWVSSCSGRRRTYRGLLCSRLGLLRRGQAPHQLLDHVELHVAIEPLLLGLLRQHVGVVEGNVARQLHGARRHELAALAVVH